MAEKDKKKKKSGIHIKEENRGKFTKQMGGKLTDAKIKKAEKSENALTRKRAVFADNARHHFKKRT